MSGNTVSTEEMKKAQERATKMREMLVAKLVAKDITFQQILVLITDPKFAPIGRIRVLQLLSSLPGWTTRTARYALITNDIPESKRLSEIIRGSRIDTVMTMLIESTPDNWQKRKPAPEGWPWFGNIFAAFNDMEDSDLPKEIREVRWKFSDVKKPGTQPDDSRDGNKDEPDNIDSMDNLESLLGDEDDLTLMDSSTDTLTSDELDDILNGGW